MSTQYRGNSVAHYRPGDIYVLAQNDLRVCCFGVLQASETQKREERKQGTVCRSRKGHNRASDQGAMAVCT